MIISTNIGGLSNRIRCLVSCMRAAKLNNISYGVFWKCLDSYETHTHLLNCSFSQLFNNPIEVTEMTNDDIVYKHHCMIITNSDQLPKQFNTFQSNCRKQFTMNDPYKRNIDFMYNQIPKKLRDEYIQYFQQLTPIDSLQQKIDKFSTQFTPSTISVHIRSWNRNGESGRRDYLFNIEKFEAVMKSKDSSVQFFLATDSQEVRNYFQQTSTLRDRILMYPRNTELNHSREQPEGVQEDLIELYLLAKNQELIGSHFSTYSETAWWLAGCPSRVTIL